MEKVILNTIGKLSRSMQNRLGLSDLRYDQVIIIGDHRSSAYLQDLKKQEVIVLADQVLEMEYLVEYLLKKIDQFSTSRTLFLIATGIHFVTHTSPSFICNDTYCTDPLPALDLWNISNWRKFVRDQEEELIAVIDHVSPYLLKNSKIAFLPPFPFKLLSLEHLTHQQLHHQSRCFANSIIFNSEEEIKNFYSIWLKDFSTIALDSLRKCIDLKPTVFEKFTDKYHELVVATDDVSPNNYNFCIWQDVIKDLIFAALKEPKLKKTSYDNASNDSSSASILEKSQIYCQYENVDKHYANTQVDYDHLVFIGHAASLLLVPNIIFCDHSLWNIIELEEKKNILLKLGSLRTNCLKKVLFIILSDISMISCLGKNCECLLLNCDQPLYNYTKFLKEPVAVGAKILKSFDFLRSIVLTIRGFNHIQVKVVMAPFTPRIYVSVNAPNCQKEYHNEMHNYIKYQKSVCFLRNPTKLLWETILKNFESSWKELMLETHIERENTLDLVTSIASSYGQENVIEWKDLSSLKSITAHSSLINWKLFILKLASLVWSGTATSAPQEQCIKDRSFQELQATVIFSDPESVPLHSKSPKFHCDVVETKRGSINKIVEMPPLLNTRSASKNIIISSGLTLHESKSGSKSLTLNNEASLLRKSPETETSLALMNLDKHYINTQVDYDHLVFIGHASSLLLIPNIMFCDHSLWNIIELEEKNDILLKLDSLRNNCLKKILFIIISDISMISHLGNNYECLLLNCDQPLYNYTKFPKDSVAAKILKSFDFIRSIVLTIRGFNHIQVKVVMAPFTPRIYVSVNAPNCQKEYHNEMHDYIKYQKSVCFLRNPTKLVWETILKNFESSWKELMLETHIERENTLALLTSISFQSGQENVIEWKDLSSLKFTSVHSSLINWKLSILKLASLVWSGTASASDPQEPCIKDTTSFQELQATVMFTDPESVPLHSKSQRFQCEVVETKRGSINKIVEKPPLLNTRSASKNITISSGFTLHDSKSGSKSLTLNDETSLLRKSPETETSLAVMDVDKHYINTRVNYDHLVFIGHATSLLLLPNIIFCDHSLWNVIELEEKQDILLKLGSLRTNCLKKVLFIFLSDISMISCLQKNYECMLLDCDQPLDIYTKSPKEPVSAKILKSFDFLRSIVLTIRGFNHIQVKVVMAPFTPRIYVSVNTPSCQKEYHNEMHHYLKYQKSVFFLGNPTKLVWETILKNFESSWKELMLETHIERENTLDLVTSIASSYGQENVIEWKDLSSLKSISAHSSLINWKLFILKLACLVWSETAPASAPQEQCIKDTSFQELQATVIFSDPESVPLHGKSHKFQCDAVETKRGTINELVEKPPLNTRSASKNITISSGLTLHESKSGSKSLTLNNETSLVEKPPLLNTRSASKNITISSGLTLHDSKSGSKSLTLNDETSLLRKSPETETSLAVMDVDKHYINNRVNYDHLVFIGHATSLLLLPNIIFCDHSLWNIIELEEKQDILLKLGSLRTNCLKKVLFIFLSDISMICCLQKNYECMLLDCDQPLDIYTKSPKEPASAKILKSFDFLRRIVLTIRGFNHIQVKVVMAPFTPRIYVSVNTPRFQKEYHNEMHHYLKYQKSVFFLGNPTKLVWETILKNFESSWKELMLETHIERENTLDLVTSIASSYGQENVIEWKDLSSLKSISAHSSLINWKLFILKLASLVWSETATASAPQEQCIKDTSFQELQATVIFSDPESVPLHGKSHKFQCDAVETKRGTINELVEKPPLNTRSASKNITISSGLTLHESKSGSKSLTLNNETSLVEKPPLLNTRSASKNITISSGLTLHESKSGSKSLTLNNETSLLRKSPETETSLALINLDKHYINTQVDYDHLVFIGHATSLLLLPNIIFCDHSLWNIIELEEKKDILLKLGSLRTNCFKKVLFIILSDIFMISCLVKNYECVLLDCDQPLYNYTKFQKESVSDKILKSFDFLRSIVLTIRGFNHIQVKVVMAPFTPRIYVSVNAPNCLKEYHNEMHHFIKYQKSVCFLGNPTKSLWETILENFEASWKELMLETHIERENTLDIGTSIAFPSGQENVIEWKDLSSLKSITAHSSLINWKLSILKLASLVWSETAPASAPQEQCIKDTTSFQELQATTIHSRLSGSKSKLSNDLSCDAKSLLNYKKNSRFDSHENRYLAEIESKLLSASHLKRSRSKSQENGSVLGQKVYNSSSPSKQNMSEARPASDSKRARSRSASNLKRSQSNSSRPGSPDQSRRFRLRSASHSKRFRSRSKSYVERSRSRSAFYSRSRSRSACHSKRSRSRSACHSKRSRSRSTSHSKRSRPRSKYSKRSRSRSTSSKRSKSRSGHRSKMPRSRSSSSTKRSSNRKVLGSTRFTSHKRSRSKSLSQDKSYTSKSLLHNKEKLSIGRSGSNKKRSRLRSANTDITLQNRSVSKSLSPDKSSVPQFSLRKTRSRSRSLDKSSKSLISEYFLKSSVGNNLPLSSAFKKFGIFDDPSIFASTSLNAPPDLSGKQDRFQNLKEYDIASKETPSNKKFLEHRIMPELHRNYDVFNEPFSKVHDTQDQAKKVPYKDNIVKNAEKPKIFDNNEEWKNKLKDKLTKYSMLSSDNLPVTIQSFDASLSVLDKLCDEIEYLGPAVKAMISSYRSMNNKEACNIFTKKENILLIDMVLEKVKLKRNSAASNSIKLGEKIITAIPVILEQSNRVVKSSLHSDIPIDLNAIARASHGKSTSFITNMIKTAFAYEGLKKPSMEYLNELFLKVCKIHLSLSNNN